MVAAVGSFEEDFAGFVRRGRIGPAEHAARAEQAARPAAPPIVVAPPPPQWRFEPLGTVYRFDAALLSVQSCQIAGGELRIGEQVLALTENASEQWQSVELPIPSNSVGELTAFLSLRALDGSEQRHEIKVVVQPRTARCTTEQLADGSVAFAIFGAEPVTLRVPTRATVQALHANAGVLHHGYLMPTLVEINFRDDLFTLHTHAVVLDGMAPHRGCLPTMQTLQWIPTDRRS